MADFRKWFYALAMVALVIGMTVPANAQGGVVTCTASANAVPIRAQGYAELVGDYTLTCTGGTPTTPGTAVPAVNITAFLSTNLTSKLVGTQSASTTAGFTEALLMFDEPNSPLYNGTGGRPLLNCGNGTGAPDSGLSGPGVCEIIAPTTPAATYDGTYGSVALGGGGADVTCTSVSEGFGCGRPNVFQGRLGASQSAGITSSVVFAGVPFDPPGTLTTRQIRITNIRADAEVLGVASSFVQQNVTLSVAVSGSTLVTITNNSQQTVAVVLNGLNMANDTKGNVAVSNLNFLQCVSENPKVGTGSPVLDLSLQPQVQFQEGFANAWKTKNIAFMQDVVTNGTVGNGHLQPFTFNGTINYPGDLAQNVPGANYNTESGFEWIGSASHQADNTTNNPQPNPNPPAGIGTAPLTNTTLGNTLFSAGNASPNYCGSASTTCNTGIQNAGVANQGTRLALSFTNIPQGASLFVPPVILLNNGVNNTGVMVLTATAADGSGGFSAPSGAVAGGAASNQGSSISLGTNALAQVSNGLAVYEILFTDPSSTERATVPVVVSYSSSLSSNPPIGLPVPGTVSQVAGGFAPFYTTAAARQPSATLPVPRFIPGAQPLNFAEVVKCACNLLFPYVVSHDGFDTGIAVSNTSLDPGSNFGFSATPQQGSVEFFYFGTGAGGQVAPSPQTSGVVPAGQVLTYVLSSGAGNIGTTGSNGPLDGRAGTGQFQGYMIAQAGFQYCHGFAFISPTGGGPLSPGVSEGYLALELDTPATSNTLKRTAQSGETLIH